MSALIHAKITEAMQLLADSQKEETEGAVLAQQIADLKRESERLLKSAREKRVIGTSQLEASQALAKEDAVASGELVVTPVAAAAPAKKRGGRPPKSAAVAPVAVAATPPATKGKAKGKAKAAPVEEPAAAAPKTRKKKAEVATPAAASAPKVARVSGEKGPPLHEKIKIVMGSKDMTIPDVIEGLKAHDKSWVPKSRDLSAYISLVLSTHLQDHFDRVKRGVYRVKKAGAAPVATPAPTPAPSHAKPGPKKAVTAQKTNGAQNPANGIDELGSNVMESPFTGAEVAA